MALKGKWGILVVKSAVVSTVREIILSPNLHCLMPNFLIHNITEVLQNQNQNQLAVARFKGNILCTSLLVLFLEP